VTRPTPKTVINVLAAALSAMAALLRHPSRRFVSWAVAGVVLLVFPVDMLVISKIDDNPDFVPAAAQLAGGRSRGVATAAALIGRQPLAGQ